MSISTKLLSGLSLSVGLLFSLNVSAQARKNLPPRFEDFAVVERFKGRPAPVNLRSHRQARRFRTVLRDGAKKGPNFAGHYTVTYWGCGTECIIFGITDARRGKVYIAPFNAGYGLDYRIDSRLLVVNPPKELEGRFGTEDLERYHYVESLYFKWDGTRLRLIHPKKPKVKPERVVSADGPSNNGMHPTRDTKALKFRHRLGRAGDAGR
jgi:hypothetical protein